MRIAFVVEGPTEEQFVARVLREHLVERGAWEASPRILWTKKPSHGRGAFRGGATGWGQIRRDIELCCRTFDVVTTMLDYYGLPADVPGRAAPVGATSDARAAFVERAIAEAIASPRAILIPNLVVHEYEALLFSDIDAIASVVPDADRDQLDAIATAFETPEHINDARATSPARRLAGASRERYDKARHGPIIAASIGLERIRARCPRFDGWLSRIEGLLTPRSS